MAVLYIIMECKSMRANQIDCSCPAQRSGLWRIVKKDVSHKPRVANNMQEPVWPIVVTLPPALKQDPDIATTFSFCPVAKCY